MLLLIIYALIAGAATVLSPCILPVLPIVLSSSIGGDRWRPFGVVAGLIASFAVATLAVSALVSHLNLPADALRNLGVVIIACAGLTLLFPEVLLRLDLVLAGIGRLGARMQGEPRRGMIGGFLVGTGLGLVWTPCAGPILATVLTLAATNRVSAGAVAVVLAYGAGAGVPMLAIAYGGQLVMQRVRRLSPKAGLVQRLFGVIMLVTAVALGTGAESRFQVWASGAFPGGWNTVFTGAEESAPVQQALDTVRSAPKPRAPAHTTAAAPSEQDSALGLIDDGPAPDFTGITNWYNAAAPLTLARLRGEVVLLDFWTYSCINCLRTLPHIRDWYARYRADGFVVIGVETPEFPFEGIPSNVAAAIKQWDITYPVAIDPRYDTWNAYGNQAWPAEYLIDASGIIRHVGFGEGEYAKTEQAIRQLLADAGHPVVVTPGAIPDLTPVFPLTPETYLGTDRMSNFASPEIPRAGTAAFFTTPASLEHDQWAVAGRWRFDTLADTALVGGASLDFTVTADKVFVIFAPGGSQDRVRVLLDGQPVVPGKTAGADVHNGVVRVAMDNLYNVVDLHGNVQTHRLRLIFETPGTQAYTFTFG